MPIKVDPEFLSLIPPLSTEERRGLEQSIIAEGCRDSIITWNNIIIDGHNRYEICKKYNIPYNVVEKQFDSIDDARIWMIRNQFSRRNLVPFVRVELAAKLEEHLAKKGLQNKAIAASKNIEKRQAEEFCNFVNKDCQISDKPNLNSCVVTPIDTLNEIAQIAGVSRDTVAKAKKIILKAPEEVKIKLRTGDLSINQAYQPLRCEDKRAQIKLNHSSIPLDDYDVILCDPPYQYEFSESKRCEVELHYPTMTLDEIKSIKVPATDNCVIFLWSPAPKLNEALEVMECWQFEYRTCAVWDKMRPGNGYWFRSHHELLLLGTRGNPRVPEPENRFPSIIRDKRIVHSKKPICIYDMIEQMIPNGKYLEIFARDKRDGWTAWGNQLSHIC